MLGVLTHRDGAEAPYAPSMSAADLPVAGVACAVRAADALIAAGATELVGDGLTPAVRRGLRRRHPDRSLRLDGDAAADTVVADAGDTVTDEAPDGDRTGDHDRIVCVPSTTVVDPAALEAAVRRRPAVVTRPSEPFDPLYGPEPRPVAVPADALRGRPPTAALAVARDLAGEGGLDRVECDRVADVRRPWELLDATEWLLAGTDDPDDGFDGIERDLAGDVHPDAEVSGPVAVREGATLGPGAVVEGPALVMPGANIGPNCYVRGNSYISIDVNIGAAVEVKNSILLSNAKLPHLSYVGDSVVGPDANVGAGSLVANLRHDERPVRLGHAGSRVSTARRKFGVVVGEGAKLGIGTRLNVGTVVAPGATTRPGSTVFTDIGGERE
ncbi:glucose-1-phosphate thymidylyltransferase (plasmid) [Halobaculum sp. CBA1158]|uniref:glucose-1-phosphate thymidylyltransferase n=1 Tax=Halobaculum sp. CBA1158 TaxID=2904243 RepID=UPI001F26BA02|nr:glucose-1-phosphate thymidylyltransferase [Halobaculum sp. CBA1158]UIP01326.1 glucose-1-phosphate thymidylyltransferase [Halobaculum sp. CBA1158]